MAAGDEWDAIQADPEFKAQPAPTQTRVALSFFNKRVAPSVPPEQLDQARHDFFSENFKPPVVDTPSIPTMAGQAIKSTLKEPVPVLGKIADAVRTDIPGAIAEGTGALAEKLSPGAGALVRGAGIAGATAVGTAGELIPKTGADLAVAGLGGPALEGAGNLAADAAPHVVSAMTGASLPEAGRAISRAKELMNPTLLKPETIDNATQAIGDSIKAARSAVGRRLGLAEDTAAAKFPGRILPTDAIADELARSLQKSGIAADGMRAPGRDISAPVKPEVQGIIDKLRNVAPEGILGPDGKPLPKIPRPLSLQDAITVKRDIYDMVSYDKSKLLGLGDKESSFLKDAAKNLDDHIRSVSPELNTATDNFSRAAKGYDKLAKNAMSGKVDTIQKRLGTIFNAGDIERKVADPLAAAGGGQAALDTLLDAKTAQRMAPLVNPKISGAFQGSGGGVLGNTLKILGAGAVENAIPVGTLAQKAALTGVVGAATSPALNNAVIRAAMVPIGQSAVVDAAASPLSRAVVTSPLMRRLSGQGKK